MGVDFFASQRAARRSACEDRSSPEGHPHLAAVIRSVVERHAESGLGSIDRRSPPRDWDRLIAQVQTAARMAEETDAEIRRREAQARSLLRSAHKRLDEARQRIDEAEERARRVETGADARVAAAEERARQAEDAARSALAWLQRANRPEQARSPDEPAVVIPPLPPVLRRVA
ncbi:hypothetical protein [Methylobacterium indicum]|uniref:hypothetical protein n=1 Tax=Methylobacterium indicum TaxID=1775910 RepID=UPI00073441C1|nr:hypothetical protein [Methylobacterium indicum]